ncbi:MAG: hypothetical protein ACQEW8_02400 [Actinomycetota bacterium]
MISSPSPSVENVPARTLLVGCGKLGMRLGQRLRERGGEVFALRRRTDSLPSDFTSIAADLARPLDEPLPEADAMVVTLPPGEGSGSYRRALTHLADALPAAPRRTVFVSSTGVFEGWDGRQPVTEKDEPTPTSERSEGLRDGELAAIELFSAAIVRPVGIYGPGREYLLRQARAGVPVDHSRRTNRIHESDLVRALELMVTIEAPPAILHAVDQGPATLGEVLTFVSALLGVPTPPAAETQGASGNFFDGSLLLRLLGHLEYPDYRAGYSEMVATARTE